ncbi:hypothetical protein WJX77_006873 [Trebouxia sp. C0004]
MHRAFLNALDRALLTPAHVISGVTVQVKRAGPRPPEADKVLSQPSHLVAGSAKQQQPFGRGPRLYVGGVADAVKEEALRHHFARWGTVADVYFPGKRGHKRVNYCFVTFEDWKSAQQACDQSERSIDGWPLDSISLAGARKPESEMHLALNSSPSASNAQSQTETPALHLAGLSGLPACSLLKAKESFQAMESPARYAASDGSSMMVPEEMQSQHHVLNANLHSALPAGGQLPSMTGHELTDLGQDHRPPPLVNPECTLVRCSSKQLFPLCTFITPTLLATDSR